MSSVVLSATAERVAAETKDPANPLYVGDMLLYPNGGEPFSRAGDKELDVLLHRLSAAPASARRDATWSCSATAR